MNDYSIENYETPFRDMQLPGEENDKTFRGYSTAEQPVYPGEQRESPEAYPEHDEFEQDLSDNFTSDEEADMGLDEAAYDQEFFADEIPNLYPYEKGYSPYALQAKKQWKRGTNDLRPEAWRGKIFGLVVHTTGGSLPGKAVGKKVYPTIMAIDTYFNSYGCHYINGWKGIAGGDLVQVANEDKLAWGVGFGDQLKSIKANRFEADLPAILVKLWKARWPAYKDPVGLAPVTNVNLCYAHMECLPVVYYVNNKTIIDNQHPPMRKGLRFTKAQHDSIAVVAYDIAVRNNWPMDTKWWRTPRFLGHEDLTPINRKDSNGGWDPGGLRVQPYIDWEYIYSQIELIHSKGVAAILSSPIAVASEVAGAIKTHSALFEGVGTGTTIPTPPTPDVPANTPSLSVPKTSWSDAARSNRYYGDKLGWSKYTYQINDFLLPYVGLQNVSLSEEKFAEAVYNWQKQKGFAAKDCDGIIGPNTWRVMSALIPGVTATPPPKPTPTPPVKQANWVATLTPLLEKYRGDIPLYFLLGWISIESGGRIEVTTYLNERGYFQIHPDESKMLKIADHNRLSTDRDFSIQAGIQLVNFLRRLSAGVANTLGFQKDSSLYWHVVKLHHWLPLGVKSIMDEMTSQSFKPTNWTAFREFVVANSEKIKQRIKKGNKKGLVWDPMQGINNVEKLFKEANRIVPQSVTNEVLSDDELEDFDFSSGEAYYETGKTMDEFESESYYQGEDY
ncbi:MAG TPA: hypothetical protein VIU12_16600 [Chryseolinea sp.]